MDKTDLDLLLKAMQQDLKDEPWLDLLRTLNITDTANSLHLQADPDHPSIEHFEKQLGRKANRRDRMHVA